MEELLTLILKGDKVLVFKKGGSDFTLPRFALNQGDTIEDILQKEIISKLNITKFNTIKVDKENYKGDRALSGVKLNISAIDIKEDNIAGLEECEIFNGQWIDIVNISRLPYLERKFIWYILKQCIMDKYSSFSMLALENEVSKAETDKVCIDVLKLKLEDKEIDQNTPKKTLIISLVMAFIVAISYSKIFYNSLGISALIYTSIIVLYFIVVNDIKNKDNYLGHFFIISALILSSTFSIYTNDLLRELNKIIIPTALVMGFLLLSYKDLKISLTSFIRAYFSRVFLRSFMSIPRPFNLLFSSIKRDKGHKDKTMYKNIRNGLLISIPLVFILSLLLSGADNVFAYYINNIGEVLANLKLDILSWRGIQSIFVGLYTLGFIWSFKYKFRDYEENNWGKKSFEPITIITILVIINILYLVFTKVQITYLYGGNSKVLPGGLTYAEYARRGFFELVVIAIINLMAIGILKIKVIKKEGKLDLTLNILYSLTTAFTLNMVASVFYKMRLYIDAFGHTRLRILVEFFIVFLAAVLLIQLAFVWREVRVFKSIIILALVMYIGINFFNIDSYIARKNIALNREGKLDHMYLTNLSFDASKQIKEALKEGKISEDTYNSWKKINEINFKSIGEEEDSKEHWYEYNYYFRKAMGR